MDILTPARRTADFPRPPVVEAVPLPVRIVLGGETVALTGEQLTGEQTGHGWRVLETTHAPTYYVPVSAFQAGALKRCARTSFCEWKGLAHYYSIRGGDRTEVDAAWGYDDPSPGYAALRHHVAVYAGRMDACFVGDEQVRPQPGQFYGGWITNDLIGPFKGAPGTEYW